ncbi:hypothetical protein HDU80_006313 [Chytriomyces hyalinus]|nr:hypothetical protein HDU80_006313 [Chytriomyces hyalinus]
MMTAHADDDFDWLFMNLTSTSTTPHTAADDSLSPACSSIMNIDTPHSPMLNYFDAFPALDELSRSNLDLEAAAASNSFTKPAEFSALDETTLTELLQLLDTTTTALNAFAQTPSPALSDISEMDFDFFSADFPLFDTSSPQTMPQTPQTPHSQIQFADSQIETLFTAAADNKSNKVLPKPRSTTTTPKCVKAAAQQQQHERSHHSFKCHFEGCTKVYAHNRNLTAHIRLDHTENSKGVNGSTQPFHCKVCNAGFRYSQTRNRHERNFHPKLT